MKLSIGRKVLFTALMVATSAAITLVAVWAAKGRSLPVLFAASFAAWWSYLLAHYTVNGKLVDKSESGIRFPAGMLPRAVFAAGAVMMVAAFPVGIVAVNRLSYAVMFASQSLFIWGYVVSHYSVAGKPV